MISGNFSQTFKYLCDMIKRAPEVRTERWQGMDATKNPALRTHELMFVNFTVKLNGFEDLAHWRQDIGPNLPWADDHFIERVSGSPLNPGTEWMNWPWASSAEKFRNKDELFNHTYAERFWPRWPRQGEGGNYFSMPLRFGVGIRREPTMNAGPGRLGIDGRYGDLEDMVELLVAEPYTRQAYFGMWHPEDNGLIGDAGRRKPCTLGYQFLVRDGKINIFYPMRSVDLRRHFRDDCYLAVRLLLWVLDRCRERSPKFWNDIQPGLYEMWMGSLHVFKNDHIELVRDGAWTVATVTKK